MRSTPLRSPTARATAASRCAQRSHRCTARIPTEILVFNGGAEALLALFFVAAEAKANVVVPTPSFAPVHGGSDGARRRDAALRVAPRKRLCAGRRRDQAAHRRRTKLILVNTPHNPSGALVDEVAMRDLDAFAQRRGIRSSSTRSITRSITARRGAPPANTRARPCSAISRNRSAYPGCAIGWLLERDPARRKELENAHGYFTVCASMLGELLAEVAARNRDADWNRARTVSERTSPRSTSGAPRTRSGSSGCGRTAR